MISILNTILMALIALLMGIIGSYLTSWEKDIYQKYFKYILPPIAMTALLFLFIDQKTSQALFFILIVGLSWTYSTKFLWNKK